MSKIWSYIIIVFGIYGILTGREAELTSMMLDIPDAAFDVCLSLVVTSCFYLGITSILKACGVVKWISCSMKGLYKNLFPGLEDEETLEYISMNLTCNMLGLGVASTPVGIKAMKKLKELNGENDKASDYMIVFLLLNITIISLFPISVVAIRQSVGSNTPLDFIVVEIFASCFTTIVTLFVERLIRKRCVD